MKQIDRNAIIINMDESNEYTNEELFLAELSPYYSLKEDLNTTLLEKVLVYRQESTRMLHNNFSFTPKQYEFYIQLLKKGKIIISAPTSFGKTTIIKEYIKTQQPKIIIYVVPTNSLADELIREFNLLYEEDGYIVIDSSVEEAISHEKILFVGTQEKLASINIFKNIEVDLFIIDEAYKLNDKINSNREVHLNRVFVDFFENSKLYVLLMPYVKNIELGTFSNFKILQTDYSPVAKRFIPIDKNEYEEFVCKSINNNDKELIYFNTPEDLEKFIINKINDSVVGEYSDNWIKRVENDFHEEWIPAKAYKERIAIHYGPMPKFFQSKMVKLFNEDSEFCTIASTSSLIEGVNTPTKNIYIMTDKIFRNYIQYKNLIGRAGRLGQYLVGNIYYSSEYNDKVKAIENGWEESNVRLVINDENNLEDINRGESKIEFQKLCDEYLLDGEQLIVIVEKFGFSIKEIRKIIEKSIKNMNNPKNYNVNYTSVIWLLASINGRQLSSLLQFKDNLSMGLILSVCIYETLDGHPSRTIRDMVTSIINMTGIKDPAYKIVTLLMKMVYSMLPYTIMPYLECITELNKLFNEKNNKICSDEMQSFISKIILNYNLKYYGKENVSEKEKKIIQKLFEYGVPYNVIKNDIDIIVNSIPDSFSIYHITKVLKENKSFEKLYSIYFS